MFKNCELKKFLKEDFLSYLNHHYFIIVLIKNDSYYISTKSILRIFIHIYIIFPRVSSRILMKKKKKKKNEENF